MNSINYYVVWLPRKRWLMCGFKNRWWAWTNPFFRNAGLRIGSWMQAWGHCATGTQGGGSRIVNQPESVWLSDLSAPEGKITAGWSDALHYLNYRALFPADVLSSFGQVTFFPIVLHNGWGMRRLRPLRHVCVLFSRAQPSLYVTWQPGGGDGTWEKRC